MKRPASFDHEDDSHHYQNIGPTKSAEQEQLWHDHPIDEKETLRVTINVDGLDQSELEELSYKLGQRLHKLVREETIDISSNNSLEELLNLNPHDYLNQRNKCLVGFLKGIANEKHTDELMPLNTAYRLAKVSETVMGLTTVKTVLPMHLRESLLQYSFSPSRLALQLHGSTTCHASYKAVQAWFNKLPKECVLTLQGDLVAAFDNNQVLSRAWHVKVEGKFTCSVITMVLYFEIDGVGKLQWQTELKPGKWLFNMDAKSMKHIGYIREIDTRSEVSDVHSQQCLYPFLQEVLNEVAAEQTVTDIEAGYACRDEIDELLEKGKRNEKYKECKNPQCTATIEQKQTIPRNKINCPHCKKNLKVSLQESVGKKEAGTYISRKSRTQQVKTSKSFRATYDPISDSSHVNEIKPEESVVEPINKSCLSDPVFVNPCSYDAVVIILRKIGEKAGIKKYGHGEREWMAVYCDGSPFNLCVRIVMCTFTCLECKITITGFSKVAQHMENEHNINVYEQPDAVDLEFDWVLMCPGPGHIEMNMLKSLVEMTWDIFWAKMCMDFNFRSDNALRSQKNVSDHHKGWEFLRIARISLTKELIVPYVRAQLCKNGPPVITPDGFMKYVMEEKEDQTYALMADIVMEIMDAIFMYRQGIRDNIPAFAFAGRGLFAKVWSARNHPLYRELEMSDSIAFARMPSEIRDFVTKTWSLNTSGMPGTGEGPDFKLEEKNKIIQGWVPSVPAGPDWERACANDGALGILRTKVFSDIGIKDPRKKGVRGERNLDEEVKKFRTTLRSYDYLSSPKPRKPQALDGSPLDEELINFCRLAREKRAKFFDVYMEHEKNRNISRTSVPFKEAPVFITKTERDEYNSLSNKDIAQLKELTVNALSQIDDPNVAEGYHDAYEVELLKKKTAKKVDYINFYQELLDYLNIESTVVCNDIDVDEV